MKNYLVKRLNNPASGLKGFIVIYKKRKNYPSLGATRFQYYFFEKEALKDAKDLARLMTYKSALAGLPYGGAKGVILAPKKYSPKEKNRILEAYAHEVNQLAGEFVTGSDMGLGPKDVENLKKKTRFVIGTKVNPEYYTALGVVGALKISLKHIFKSPEFKDRTFFIQGLGKTGLNILKLLTKEKGVKIYASDTDKNAEARVKKVFPKVEIVSSKKAFGIKTDVFMPCAVGGVLNKKNIARIRSKIILGSANNQLADKDIGYLLQKRGVFYAPDYLVNSGGLISVAEELVSKNPSKQSIIKKIERIPKRLEKIILESKKTGLPPNVTADRIAEGIFKKWK